MVEKMGLITAEDLIDHDNDEWERLQETARAFKEVRFLYKQLIIYFTVLGLLAGLIVGKYVIS